MGCGTQQEYDVRSLQDRVEVSGRDRSEEGQGVAPPPPAKVPRTEEEDCSKSPCEGETSGDNVSKTTVIYVNMVRCYSGTSDKGPSEIGTTSLQRTLVSIPC